MVSSVASVRRYEGCVARRTSKRKNEEERERSEKEEEGERERVGGRESDEWGY